MKYWLFRLLFRKELKRFAQLPHPELRRMLNYTGACAADFVIADLSALALRAEQVPGLISQRDRAETHAGRMEDALRASNSQLLRLWASAYQFLPDTRRADFKDLGVPFP